MYYRQLLSTWTLHASDYGSFLLRFPEPITSQSETYRPHHEISPSDILGPPSVSTTQQPISPQNNHPPLKRFPTAYSYIVNKFGTLFMSSL